MTDSNPYSIELSDEQKAIVETDEDTIVISNPGTGKTFTLALKVIRLLENGIDPEDILCITFTDKARQEMFEAIYGMSKGKFPDSTVMKINIHTFHSFAYNYLLDVGLISGDIIKDNILKFSILESFVANQALHYGKAYIISDIVPKVRNAIRYIKSFGLLPDKIDLKDAEAEIEKLHDEDKSSFTTNEMKAFLKFFIEAYKHYEDSKKEAIDYSDMLLIFIEKFHGRKFPHVLVDEMQDMNEIEAQIVRMVRERLFLVGDSKQAIFGFQGGSTENFQEFAKTCKPMLLSANKRSTQEILDYSKNYFLSCTNDRARFEKELENFNSSTSGPVPKVFSTAGHLTKILSLIEENPGKKIGILARTNKQVIEISKHLDINNIDYTSASSRATSLDARDAVLTFIKGLLSDHPADKISATFTVFSPYSLREAFDFAAVYKENENDQQIANINLGKINLTRESLDQLFSEKIYPLCVAKGSEWFSSAVLVREQISEYLKFKTPILEELFDFLAVGDIGEQMERSKNSEITLSTVHKAKGRTFDVVIYLPSRSAPPLSWIDTIVSAILISEGKDIRSEIAEETIRTNFVAFTRPKEKLFVIIGLKLDASLFPANLSEFETDAITDPHATSVLDIRLREAYALFVGGRLADAEKLLKSEDPWLEEYIISYFQSVDHFSWSSVKTNPDNFLMDNIIKLPYSSGFGSGEGKDFGLEVHQALEKILLDKAKPEDFRDQVQMAVKNGMSSLKDLENKFPGLKVEDTEVHVNIPLNSITKYEHDDLTLDGKIDVLLKHNSGYLLVDWKTDKRDNSASEHKRQLSVYKKMYSISANIPEDKITTCVIFVALRGGVNTGKFDQSTHIGTKDAQVFKTFDAHLQTVLEWRKDPAKFIKALLERPTTDPLLLAIKEKLADNSK